MERKVYMEPTKLPKTLSVKNIYAIHSYWYSPTFHFEGESHEPVELVYVQTGSTIVSTNAYSAILQPGQMILHRPWDFHKIRANGVSCHVLIFTFGLSKNSPIREITDRVFVASDVDRYLISTIYHLGANLVGGKNACPPSTGVSESSDPQVVKDSLELLLLYLFRFKTEQKALEEKKNPLPTTSPRMAKIISYLEANVSRRITLQELATQSGYSVSRLCNLFRKETGDTVIHYLNNLRIQKACEYISKGDKSFKDISDLLSFDSVQYFSKEFKKIVGVTPSQFREQVKTDNAYLTTHYEKTHS